ncbi:EF hand [Necator americanus]|uniref:EF hand n=1 Tax=Necator americanus TaxID=51031 RepID=W2T5M3_NECAM|nr:EF hand [Necator americanus]ETN77305.1 EF hand [Necator americanus]
MIFKRFQEFLSELAMSFGRRRAALTFPMTDEFEQPIIDFTDFKDDVALLSPIHQNIFRPTSLQQVSVFSVVRKTSLFSLIGEDSVVDETHFSKNEIRAIYRAFKETSPNAVINKSILREKFAELFPHGDIEHYSDLLFDTFDNDGNGTINFQEFVKALSVLCRGTIDEKIDWLYKLYDPKGKGEITWHRLFYVITSMDDLMGRRARPLPTREQRAQHAHNIFQDDVTMTKSLLMYFGGTPDTAGVEVVGHCRGLYESSNLPKRRQTRSDDAMTESKRKIMSSFHRTDGEEATTLTDSLSTTSQPKKFDIGKRGRITKEDFFTVCKTDQQIIESMSSLYTIFPG